MFKLYFLLTIFKLNKIEFIKSSTFEIFIKSYFENETSKVIINLPFGFNTLDNSLTTWL